MTDLREELGLPTPEEIKEKMRLEQINNLQEYNQVKIRQISFNNVKIMVLEKASAEHVEEEIERHFDEYQDDEERELLLTFLNKHK